MGFMNFLNDIDNVMTESMEIEEVVVVDDVVELVAPTTKDTTVELLEYRLKDKLGSVGLASALINEVIESVFGGVGSIKEPIHIRADSAPKKPKSKKTKTTKSSQVTTEAIVNDVSLAELAGSILEGVPETMGQPSSMMSETSNQSTVDMSKVADQASALL